MAAAGGEPGALAAQCKELQRQLDAALRERDELVRDLESFCLSDGGTTFNSSSVLQERIYSTEKELAQHRAALAATTAERDGLREDLGAVKEAKRRAEQGFKAQLERAAALDKELAFYQAGAALGVAQSARVVGERDRAVWEREELKAANLRLEQQLREASSRAETEASQRAQLERQLADTQQQLKAAQAKAAEAQALPGLRQELAAAQAEVARLAEREQQLEQEGAGLRSQLADARAAADAAATEAAEARRGTDELAAAHAVVQQQLRGEVAELQGSTAQLEQQLQEAQAAAEEARGAQQVAEAAAAEQRQQQEADVAALVAHHADEVASLRRQLTQQQEAAAAARAAVDEAAKEKVAALVRLSEAESGRSKAGGRVEQLTKEVATLREQLEDATREKVAALLRVAEMQGGGGRKVVGSPGRTDSANGDAGSPAKSPAKQQQQQAASPAKPRAGSGWWGSPARAN